MPVKFCHTETNYHVREYTNIDSVPQGFILVQHCGMKCTMTHASQLHIDSGLKERLIFAVENLVVVTTQTIRAHTIY